MKKRVRPAAAWRCVVASFPAAVHRAGVLPRNRYGAPIGKLAEPFKCRHRYMPLTALDMHPPARAAVARRVLGIPANTPPRRTRNPAMRPASAPDQVSHERRCRSARRSDWRRCSVSHGPTIPDVRTRAALIRSRNSASGCSVSVSVPACRCAIAGEDSAVAAFIAATCRGVG